jgi:hypothetical protein
MNTAAANPRAVIGSNEAPDYAKMETARLVDECRGLVNTLEELGAEAKKIEEVTDDPTALQTGGIIKRFRDLYARLENTRVVEVEPNLRRMNAANAFFKGLQKMIQPEDKNERRTSPGWIDILQAKINAHQDRKEEAERKRLAIEAAETARLAREAQERADRARAEEDRLKRAAEERQLEAERARAPAQIEIKAEIATQASQAAGVQAGTAIGAEHHAQKAIDAAQDAHIATLAKSADLVRTRGVTEDGAGVTLTKARESYAYVTDRDKLDKVKVWNMFSDDEVEKAVRKWARATGHNEKMAGAEIGWRTKGVTR